MIAVVALAFLAFACAQNDTNDDASKKILIAGQYVFEEDGWELFIASRIALDNVVLHRSVSLPAIQKAVDDGYTFEFRQYDTQGYQKFALEQTLLAAEDGVKVIVGPSYSSESVVVSLLSNVFEIPAVSYSATSPRLSDKSTFPLFFRNVPSDSAQGRALAELVKEFKQDDCIVVHSDESYGLGITEVFRERAREIELNIASTITIPEDADVATITNALQTAVEVIFGDTAADEDRQPRNIGTFVFLNPSPTVFEQALLAAQDLGLLGEPFIWITSDGGAALNLNKADERLDRNNLKGIFGTTVVTPTSDIFKTDLEARWAEEVAKGEDIVLYSQVAKLRDDVNLFAPYAYDAMMIVLHAVDSLFAKGRFQFNQTELVAQLKLVEFEGVTGVNKFDENHDRDPVYDIVNSLGADGSGWNVAGAYQDGVNLRDDYELSFSNGGSVPPSFAYKEPLAAGVVALIVIVAVLAALLLGAVLVYVVARARAAAAEAAEAAANAPAERWSGEDEALTVADYEESAGRDIDESGGVVSTLTGALAGKVRVAYADDATALFGVERGGRCAIDTDLDDSLVLVNETGAPLAYTITLPDAADECSFELSARPGTGTLGKGERRAIALQFRMLFTTKVARWIKVEFDGIGGAVLVPLRVEGELSSRLDPMELELHGKPLGEGAFGIVYRGRYRGAQVAAKVPRNQGDMKESHLSSFLAEIALFEKLRNPYIVNFVGASRVPGRLCICTELLERGTVLDLIHRAKVSLVLKVKFCLDAAEALDYLHQNGVLYRDLKPENLLVFSVSHGAQVNCKLSDFGTSMIVDDPTTMKKLTGSVGTPIYMAPEMIANQSYNCKVDVYSLAMTTWELMEEKAPFGHLKRIWDLPRLVLEGMRPELNEKWDETIQEVISNCWMHAPEKRPTAKQSASALRKYYGTLKGGYEQEKDRQKQKKQKKKAQGQDTSSGSSAPHTAHTGELKKIVQMAEDHKDDAGFDGNEKLTVADDVKDAPTKTKKKKSKKTKDL